MKKKLKIFVIAGEISGDVLGGEIMQAAKDFSRRSRGVAQRRRTQTIEFIGVGGENMKAAGLKSIFPISDLAVMGFAEVIAKGRTLVRRINQTADAIVKERPDVVLTIDSSSFAVRVIKKVRKKLHGENLPRFEHVVAPMVWAWGAWRAKIYAKIFDRMYCFFDFEKPYFTKYGLDTVAIGYPIYNIARRHMKAAKKKYVALLPGSRMGEVSKMMPVYKEFAAMHPDYNFAIPTTEATQGFIEREIKSWKKAPKLVSFKDRYKLYNETRFAIATSGTATAELAIMHIPAVVVYKMNWLTTQLAHLVRTINYMSLVNILADRHIYPELHGKGVTAENIAKEFKNINEKKMISELKAADKLWHKSENPMRVVVASLRGAA